MTAIPSQAPQAREARAAAEKRFREPPDAFGFQSGPMTVTGEQLVSLERSAFVEGYDAALSAQGVELVEQATRLREYAEGLQADYSLANSAWMQALRSEILAAADALEALSARSLGSDEPRHRSH